MTAMTQEGDGLNDTDASDAASPDQVDESADATAAKKKRPGCFKVGCLTLLSMFVVIALAVGGVALYVNHELGKIQHSNALLPTGGPARDAAAGDAQNILLLGSDSRGTNLRANGRSDVIQLMHISSDRRSIQ